MRLRFVPSDVTYRLLATEGPTVVVCAVSTSLGLRAGAVSGRGARLARDARAQRDAELRQVDGDVVVAQGNLELLLARVGDVVEDVARHVLLLLLQVRQGRRVLASRPPPAEGTWRVRR